MYAHIYLFGFGVLMFFNYYLFDFRERNNGCIGLLSFSC